MESELVKKVMIMMYDIFTEEVGSSKRKILTIEFLNYLAEDGFKLFYRSAEIKRNVIDNISLLVKEQSLTRKDLSSKILIFIIEYTDIKI